MRVRFNINPDGEPHIHDHHVGISEVLEVLPSRDGNGIFVVTAYDLTARQVRAMYRRLRRRR